MAVNCRALFLRVAFRQALVLHVPCPSRMGHRLLHSKLLPLAKPQIFGFSISQYSNSALERQEAVENATPTTRERMAESAEEFLNSLSPEMEKKLKVIKLEYEVMLHMNESVSVILVYCESPYQTVVLFDDCYQ